MTLRKYGSGPIDVVVLHGGPGAPGYMAPVARELADEFSVLEPLQGQSSLDGQIHELHQQIQSHCVGPVTVIGSSWGATLALLYASEHPETLTQIILSGSCVYDAESSATVKKIRLERMNAETKALNQELTEKLMTATKEQKSDLFRQLAECSFDSDCFDPITRDLELVDCQLDINEQVWGDFKRLRDRPNALHTRFAKIQQAVFNFHGDYDPHVLAGIDPFLRSCLANYELIVLPQCGHYPWIERHAKAEFFAQIRRLIWATKNADQAQEA